MIGLYLSCVAIRSEEIPTNEWLFYLYMVVSNGEVVAFSW